MKISFSYLHTHAGLELHRKPVLKNGDFGNKASHQRFVKFGDIGGLLTDEILQVVDLL